MNDAISKMFLERILSNFLENTNQDAYSALIHAASAYLLEVKDPDDEYSADVLWSLSEEFLFKSKPNKKSIP